jgi:chemotaxis-related protein WspD
MNLEDAPGEKTGEEKARKRLMVVSKDGEQWVFPVNEIHGIHHFNPSLLQNVPVTIAKCKSTFTEGIIKWDEKHVALLDDELLFYNLKRSLQ